MPVRPMLRVFAKGIVEDAPGIAPSPEGLHRLRQFGLHLQDELVIEPGEDRHFHVGKLFIVGVILYGRLRIKHGEEVENGADIVDIDIDLKIDQMLPGEIEAAFLKASENIPVGIVWPAIRHFDTRWQE